MFMIGGATRDNKKPQPPVSSYLSHIQMVVNFMVDAEA